MMPEKLFNAGKQAYQAADTALQSPSFKARIRAKILKHKVKKSINSILNGGFAEVAKDFKVVAEILRGGK